MFSDALSLQIIRKVGDIALKNYIIARGSNKSMKKRYEIFLMGLEGC